MASPLHSEPEMDEKRDRPDLPLSKSVTLPAPPNAIPTILTSPPSHTEPINVTSLSMKHSASLPATTSSPTRPSGDHTVTFDSGNSQSEETVAGFHLNAGPVTGISHRATFVTSEGDVVHGPPPLHFKWSPKILAAYVFFVAFCNLALPCLLFYLIREYAHKIDLRTNIGISSASLGLSSCFDAPFRLYKLTRYRRLYGPLHDSVWWHGDFFMWTYTFALFCFAFPLAIAPALNPVGIDFFLMSTVLLIQPFGLVLFLTLLPRIRTHGWSSILGSWLGRLIWTSSEAPLSPIKPGIFYMLEDLGAVDFRQGRVWRESCYERYAHSPPFRVLMHTLTIFFVFMTLVYTGTTAAVTWCAPLEFAFAYVLGQLFIWIGVTAILCYLLVLRGLHLEKAYWVKKGWKGWYTEGEATADWDGEGGRRVSLFGLGVSVPNPFMVGVEKGVDAGSGRVSRMLEKLSIAGMDERYHGTFVANTDGVIPSASTSNRTSGAGTSSRPHTRARSKSAMDIASIVEAARRGEQEGKEQRARASSAAGLLTKPELAHRPSSDPGKFLTSPPSMPTQASGVNVTALRSTGDVDNEKVAVAAMAGKEMERQTSNTSSSSGDENKSTSSSVRRKPVPKLFIEGEGDGVVGVGPSVPDAA